MAVAADVPGIYDVVIDGNGYMLARTQPTRATYSISPTFIPRSNIQGDYGDDQQDFWMTATQRDWSFGEQQRYFRTDESSARRFWHGTNIDVSIPGQVSLRQTFPSIGFSAAISAVGGLDVSSTVATTVSRAYSLSDAGAITDLGAHSLGVAPTTVVGDGNFLYLSSAATGSVGVRKYASGSWTTFSATLAHKLAFLNNTLYGLSCNNSGTSNTSIYSYDTAGTATTIFTWKGPDGGALNVYGWGSLIGYGGKVVVGLNFFKGAQLWQYDGNSTSIFTQLPPNFFIQNLAESAGILWIGGAFLSAAGNIRPAVFFYVNGSVGLLWRADTLTTSTFTGSQLAAGQGACASVAAHENGVVFNDDTTGQIMYWNASTGGVSSIAAYTVAGDTPLIAATSRHFLHSRNQTTGYQFPGPSYATSGTVISSLYDFDSSLQKRFGGVIVEWAAAPDGNGGTVDIAYQTDSVDGNWTTLQTSAVSGTEYTLTNVTGRSIAIRVTLNKGTSTKGPVLKHWYVRASPVKQNFRRCEYLLDLSGRDGRTPVVLRNGVTHPKDGLTMATELDASASATAAISITDAFGTFTGIIDPDAGYEIVETGPQEFVARVNVREV